MSDNVGLSTPRGSGTSGYVQRNLAHIRPRDSGAPYPPPRGGDSSSSFDDAPRHRQRQPDKGILEHDRKRAVEVKVLELRDELEDAGELDEDEIEDKCAALRKRLLAEGAARGGGPDRGKGGRPGGGLKMHQVHEMADQKIRESERLRRALKISRDYEEGAHWKRQDERAAKAAERADGEGDDRPRERED